MTLKKSDKQQQIQKQYTWKEIAKHNAYNDCWLAIDDVVYDVSKFADTHPGGDIILLGGGTDASIMASSYHPNGINPDIMKKYAIGVVKYSDNKVSEEESYYDNLSTDEFYNALKTNVVDYFKKNKISRRGEGAPLMYVKSLFIFVNFLIGLYYMTVYGSYLGAIWMGTMAAEIGINIMHDGSHGAFSKNSWMNTISCWTMDMIGSSSYVWESQHVGGHHLFTNLENDKTVNPEIDPDIFSSYPFIRMHPSSDRKGYHKYQHIYGPMIFMAFTMMKVLYNDYACFYYNKVMHISMNQRLSSKKNLVRITMWKILSMIYMMFLPMYYNGILKGFLLFMVAHFVCGVILAFMFIVTHVSDGCNVITRGRELKEIDIQTQAIQMAQKKFNIKNSKQASEFSWAALQCKTSINWCLNSVFWNNFSGGLNHQIEHHLFPGICHMHYPQLQQIVEKTCAEWNVPYIRHETFYSAVAAMIQFLKDLGNPPQNQKQQNLNKQKVKKNN